MYQQYLTISKNAERFTKLRSREMKLNRISVVIKQYWGTCMAQNKKKGRPSARGSHTSGVWGREYSPFFSSRKIKYCKSYITLIQLFFLEIIYKTWQVYIPHFWYQHQFHSEECNKHVTGFLITILLQVQAFTPSADSRYCKTSEIAFTWQC
jgi:hypothetical protein